MNSHDLLVGADAFLEDGSQVIDGVRFVSQDRNKHDFTAIPLCWVEAALAFSEMHNARCDRVSMRNELMQFSMILNEPIHKTTFTGTVSI